MLFLESHSSGLCIMQHITQGMNWSTYCTEQQFHLSFLPTPAHNAPILCMKRWATKSWYDSSDETSIQKIPSNWFPEITLWRNKLWKSTEWKKKRACACVHEEKSSHAQVRMRREIHILIHVTDDTMGNLHLKEIPLLFTRKKETPGSSTYQAARDPERGRKGGQNVRLHIKY